MKQTHSHSMGTEQVSAMVDGELSAAEWTVLWDDASSEDKDRVLLQLAGHHRAGEALRSLAALTSLLRFSASSRSAVNSFVQTSDGPEIGGAAKRSIPGAALPGGKGEPLAGGGVDWLGNGAGNVPCAPVKP